METVIGWIVLIALGYWWYRRRKKKAENSVSSTGNRPLLGQYHLEGAMTR